MGERELTFAGGAISKRCCTQLLLALAWLAIGCAGLAQPACAKSPETAGTAATAAAAETAGTAATAATAATCRHRLDQLGVDYVMARRKGIADAVEVRGRLGGVIYEAYRPRPLVLDCSLVYSLAMAGRYLAEAGIDRVTYSSAYEIRNIRGTRRRSTHSYGLAIDVHEFHSRHHGLLRVADDYEQGLGDRVDCIGAPLTVGGAILKTLACRFERSELFGTLLGPDYDAGHHNHFHLQALPWKERKDLTWRRPSP